MSQDKVPTKIVASRELAATIRVMALQGNPISIPVEVDDRLAPGKGVVFYSDGTHRLVLEV